jgi:hypothetical protein
MALRPAGKTLSSLTGILVMAAALWLLLNFVYAPSCGRFACSLEPAWWPQAEADSGDACPDSISAAADDAKWPPTGSPFSTLVAGVLLDVVSPRAALVVFTAVGLALALWHTFSPTLRNAPSLTDLERVKAC